MKKINDERLYFDQFNLQVKKIRGFRLMLFSTIRIYLRYVLLIALI